MTDQTTDSEPLLEGIEEYSHRWWIHPAASRDQYELYIMRYEHRTVRDDVENLIDLKNQWYFSPPSVEEHPGGWIEAPPGTLIEPAYVFPGAILHILHSTGLLVDRRDIAEELQEMAVQILGQALTAEFVPKEKNS